MTMLRWNCAAALAAVYIGCAVPATAQTERGRETAQMCVACHGLDGNSPMASNAPRLAGQLRDFLGLQLRQYGNGERPHPVMSPIAKALTAEQIAELAEWYAAQAPKPSPPSAAAPSDVLRIGERLYTEGKPGAPACRLCHGAQAQGTAPAAARLAGQHTDYLVAAIDRYRKSTELKANPSLVMKAVVHNLQEPEVQAVAQYLQTLN